MHTIEWQLNWKRPSVGHMRMTERFWLVAHPEKLFIGDCVDIGAFTYIQALEGVDLHEQVEIGSHCSIYSVSTIDGKQGRVVIGKCACIGSHSTIMPGVTIGCGSVIAAHSFVNHDVPPHQLWGGVPAKYMSKLS